MEINPMKIDGNWDEGYALDVHMKECHYIGEDEWGHPKFDNKRSDLGEAVFLLKNRNDYSQIPILAEAIINFLKTSKLSDKINVIIVTPPSTKREKQPILEIAKQVSKELNYGLATKYLESTNTTPLKNLNTAEKQAILKGHLKRKEYFTEEAHVLIIDDLFASGSTINAMCNLIKEDKNVKEIYVVALTKVRRTN